MLGDFADPQLIGPGGSEVPIDQVLSHSRHPRALALHDVKVADPGTPGRLAEAAGSLLDSLNSAQRSVVALPFDEEVRQRWRYTPGRRAGLSVAEMGRHPAKAAHRLLATALGLTAYAQATTIMGLEDVLDTLEGGRGDRHAGDYWLAVFGEPGEGEVWGWRFEGHHVSVNYTLAGQEVVGAPLFLGANPAALRQGDTAVLRPLGQEEDLARALVESLPGRQRARAVIDDQAPDDIVSGTQSRLAGQLEPMGLPASDMAGQSADLLGQLIATYIGRLPKDLASARWARLEEAGLGHFHFAWAGETQPGRPHYYRVQGPRFLVELDNTQDGANHVHTVMRDPEDDFGHDLLRAHRQVGHGHGASAEERS